MLLEGIQRCKNSEDQLIEWEKNMLFLDGNRKLKFNSWKTTFMNYEVI